HLQPPIRGGRDHRCRRGVLHLRRGKPGAGQRFARYSSLPGGEWQAALRPHTDTSVAGEFPGRTGRWPERRRARSGSRSASKSTVAKNGTQEAQEAQETEYFLVPLVLFVFLPCPWGVRTYFFWAASWSMVRISGDAPLPSALVCCSRAG